MTAVLPDAYTVRPPMLEDAQAVLELVSDYNTSVVGFADYTLDDAQDELTEPGFDPVTDGWLVFDDGRLVGYGSIFGKGDHRQLDLDVVTTDPVVERYLLDRLERRAAEIATQHGHPAVQVDIVNYQADKAREERLAGYGFERGTIFHRMRIDHDGTVPTPAVPAGVTVRRGAPDEASRRAAHDVMNASFAGQFGFSPRSYEEWHASLENFSAFDWSQLTVLELDGEVVAMQLCNDQFVEDENCGYVGRLGVLEKARGKGLAKFLLRDQFALDAAAGRTGTILHVDTNNPTPALGVYLSVGMQATLVMEVWRREVTAA
ncbi:ribosomal protein S18 acetylase RimI-like enzyme [Kribbella sp. VKM Ac-2569]|uniref:GNAT family N-acetyltransferase n=1 Tax=Kribbella sp. VKM Ac-2569 TaxID=2512220 RepID=UPI00102CA4CF|nr:GNAT family N-acetyltransferase [Kribbella sp. VKM Ac-2569]RZT26474.1 ribosomal protein S18 acetylase RimI-like enzyme [Kribbella sp. VKM Ac-2569]